jgi:iron complex transport system substrate-binding protein
MPRPLRTHRLLASLATAAAALALAACGSDSSGSSDGGAAAGSAGGDFPVTISTVLGEVTVQSADRVVVLDAQSLDVVLALGITPIAYDLGSYDTLDSTPWLRGKAAGEFRTDFVSVDGKIDVEAVTDLEPDVIITETWLGGEDEDFTRMSDFAPVVTSNTDAVSSWQQRVTFLAEALGREDAGTKLIAETEAEIAASTKGLESLDGMTYNYIAYAQEQGGFWYGNGQWLGGYGLSPLEGQDNSHTDFKVISLENVSQFDADVLVIWAMADADRSALLGNTQFQALPAVQASRLIWMDLPLAIATNTPGPLSMGYTLGIVSEQLLKSVD